jgi:hypothetical protein
VTTVAAVGVAYAPQIAIRAALSALPYSELPAGAEAAFDLAESAETASAAGEEAAATAPETMNAAAEEAEAAAANPPQ